MYECFHCGERAVVWQNDFSFDEYFGREEEGLVHILQCSNCGAYITYEIPFNREDEEDNGEDARA